MAELLRLDAREAGRRARELGADDAGRWPPGESWASPEGGALVRVGEPEPGEGHHREHVRLLRGAGEAEPLARLLDEVIRALPDRLRLETAAVAGQQDAWIEALTRCGLDDEGLLPGAWREHGGREAPLRFFGRPSARRREPPEMRAPAAPERARGPEPELRVHASDTRAGLARFLDRLVPGRAYPAGTLLSEAERSEGRRSGDLEAEWVLALSGEAVVGGVVLEPDPRPERAHVRRLHVDVAPGWRGRGLASALLRRARERAAELGASRVEADPRSGHAVVRRALEAAGLETCVIQRGAWRLRTATASWDEDVLLLSAPAG